jgi:CRP-like cAMP-binding protein
MSWNRHMGADLMQDTSFGVLTGNNVETRFFKAGTIIFHQGDAASEMFVIKSGTVRIQLGNRTLSELPTESIFGEMALIDNEPRSATAIAITDVELVPVTEKQFLFMVGQTPYFALKVMRVLAQRLRATSKTFG